LTNPTKLKVPVSGSDELRVFRSGDALLLEGTLIVARDQAHKRLVALLGEGGSLPFDPKGAFIYYMGPSPARPGRVMGAAGPTTSGRMDGFTVPLLETGVKGLLGKGRRSDGVKASLLANGAIYLAAVGGAGAFYGNLVGKSEVLAWPELGPEALLAIEVRDFPVLVILDLHGNDLYGSGPEKWKKTPSGS
jgi:fumarate hydratase subunit beta